MSLANKIRKAREQVVEAGGFKFTIRRPSDVEMMELGRSGPVSRLFPYIVGWDGVKEIDVIPGGSPTVLPFDADVCKEWLSDRPDLLTPVMEQITQSYRDHVTALQDSKKN